MTATSVGQRLLSTTTLTLDMIGSAVRHVRQDDITHCPLDAVTGALEVEVQPFPDAAIVDDWFVASAAVACAHWPDSTRGGVR